MSEVSQQQRIPGQRSLISVGLLCWGLTMGIAVLSSRFALSVPSAERPHLLMLSLWATLFAAYLVALRIAMRGPQTGRTVGIVMGFAVIFRITLLFTTPIQEIDVYRYLWDGNTLTSGVSPYRYSPQNVIQTSDSALSTNDTHGPSRPHHVSPELWRLVALDRQSPALRESLRTVHFPELTTPYPPVSQAVFALAALMTPDSAPTMVHLIVIKSWVVLFDLLTIVALFGLLHATGRPLGWCVAYAWCPLVLKEFANSGHLDAIAVCFTTAAIWLLVTADLHRRGRIVMAAIALGLGVGAKLFAILLLPMLIVWLWGRSGRTSAVIFGLLVVGMSMATLWPMFSTDTDPPHQYAVADESVEQDSDRSGLKAFLARWQINDLAFLVIYENLNPSRPRLHQPWFAIVPDDIRMTIVSPLMHVFELDGRSAAFLLARGLTLATFTLVTFWLAANVWMAQKNARSPEETGRVTCQLIEAVFLTLAWFWLLSPTQNPWYWTWCLPFLPFARSRVWLWVSGLTMAYYLRFWLNANWPQPPGPWNSQGNGASFFDVVLVWFEFGPVFIGLLVCWLIRRRHREQ